MGGNPKRRKRDHNSHETDTRATPRFLYGKMLALKVWNKSSCGAVHKRVIFKVQFSVTLVFHGSSRRPTRYIPGLLVSPVLETNARRRCLSWQCDRRQERDWTAGACTAGAERVLSAGVWLSESAPPCILYRGFGLNARCKLGHLAGRRPRCLAFPPLAAATSASPGLGSEGSRAGVTITFLSDTSPPPPSSILGRQTMCSLLRPHGLGGIRPTRRLFSPNEPSGRGVIWLVRGVRQKGQRPKASQQYDMDIAPKNSRRHFFP